MLPRVDLDTVTWAELVDAARSQVAAASSGAWTHHAEVDAGITLLDLYAWLFEQRVYWLDQVDESTKRAILALLDVRPRPTGVARGVVALEVRPNSAAPAAMALPSGALLVRGLGNEATGFTTQGALHWHPIERIELVARGRDQTADLARGRAIRLFTESVTRDELACPPCAPLAPTIAHRQVELRLHWAAPHALDPGTVHLLVELDGPPERLPDWELDGVEVGDSATLSWEVQTASGWEAVAVVDGTHALRRTGIVEVPAPATWVSSSDGAYVLRLSWIAGVFTVPPRVTGLRPNAVVAAHEVPASWELEVDWLPLPGQIALLGEPSTAHPLPGERPIARTLTAALRTGATWSDPWESTADLRFHPAADRVFAVDRQAAALRFGDGIHGRIPRPEPAPSAPNLRVEGAVGGGRRGALARGLFFEIATGPGDAAALRARLATDTRGGRDAEDLDAALRRAATELGRRHRAIARADFVEIALGTPGVELARAHAVAGVLRGHCGGGVPGAVTVFVVPAAPRSGTAWDDAPTAWADPAPVPAPIADPATLEQVALHLEAHRLIGTEVEVRTPEYRSVALEVAIRGEIDDSAGIRTGIATALQRYLDPLVGGPEGTGWPFGGPLRPSELMDAARAALTDRLVVERVAIAVDGGPAEDCETVEIGPHDLVTLDAIAVALFPSAVQGGLR